MVCVASLLIFNGHISSHFDTIHLILSTHNYGALSLCLAEILKFQKHIFMTSSLRYVIALENGRNCVKGFSFRGGLPHALGSHTLHFAFTDFDLMALDSTISCLVSLHAFFISKKFVRLK